MNKMLMKRVIIDVQNQGCPEAHITPLLECFEGLMASIARTGARRASFELADLRLASQRGLGAYSLEMERMLGAPGDHIWTGTFADGQRTLRVMGCLEAC
jgi:hypothetical protein